MFDEAQKVLTEGLKTYPNSDGLTGALVSLDIHVAHSEAAQALAEKQARQKPRDIEAQRIYLRTLIINGTTKSRRHWAANCWPSPHTILIFFI